MRAQTARARQRKGQNYGLGLQVQNPESSIPKVRFRVEITLTRECWIGDLVFQVQIQVNFDPLVAVHRKELSSARARVIVAYPTAALSLKIHKD